MTMSFIVTIIIALIVLALAAVICDVIGLDAKTKQVVLLIITLLAIVKLFL